MTRIGGRVRSGRTQGCKLCSLSESGVASDIAVGDVADTQVCIKFALAKLKVAVDWHAPVPRNAVEYDWLNPGWHLQCQNEGLTNC